MMSVLLTSSTSRPQTRTGLARPIGQTASAKTLAIGIAVPHRAGCKVFRFRRPDRRIFAKSAQNLTELLAIATTQLRVGQCCLARLAMLRIGAAVVVTLVLMATAACGGSVAANGTGTGSGGGADAGTGSGSSAAAVAYNGAPVPIGQFAATVADVLCETAVQCHKKALGGKFATVDGCKAFLVLIVYPTSLSKLVAAGKVKYDAAAAGKCLQRLSSTCDAGDGSDDPTCRSAFQGTGAEGAACEKGQECASHECTGSVASGCPGKCSKKKATAGEACAADADCESNLSCADTMCAALPVAKLGEDCSKSECEKGLHCSFVDSKFTCRKPGMADAICFDHADCSEGFYCNQQIPNTNQGVCTAWAKVGDLCKAGQFSATSPCPPASKCVGDSPTAICTALAGLGGTCASTNLCAGDDLICMGGHCELLPKKGQACTPPDPKSGGSLACLPPAVCAAKVCQDLPTEGEPCAGSACASELICDAKAKVCKAPPGDGEPCTGQCKSGFACSFGGKATGTCKAVSCPGP